MERWLWFALIALACYFAYDYGARTEREKPLAAELQVYRDREALRAELAEERRDRAKAIGEAVARVAQVRIQERAEAAATDLERCPVPEHLERLRHERDVEANAAIDRAYGDPKQ